jgi:hypothetical protein
MRELQHAVTDRVIAVTEISDITHGGSLTKVSRLPRKLEVCREAIRRKD